MSILEKINERASEHHEASIGEYGWEEYYEMQVDNAQVALLRMNNNGDGSYSMYVWTAPYTDGFLRRLGDLLDTFPSNGGAWDDDNWEAIQKLFHYHFSTSAG